VRAGIAEIGPKLIGHDPTQLWPLNHHMDAVLRGHPYVKAPIDIACWDILGKAAGLPLHTLLGGAAQDRIALYRAISQEDASRMAEKIAGYRAEGYTKFQLKVGAAPGDDIERIRACRAMLQPSDVLVADANTGWTMADAARVANAVRDVDVYIEQPCMTYEECLSIRRRTTLPFVLDESIGSAADLLRGIAEDAFDVVNLKISKVGGLTKARLMRDLCVQSGIPMTIEDTWGGDIVTATIAHLARSTPEKFRFTATDFNSYVTVGIAEGAPRRVDGFMTTTEAPGLGVEPRWDVLGDPVMVIS